ncbi:restriction endonuclease [bacterium]|nr:restriction endonuclease [bacterium]
MENNKKFQAASFFSYIFWLLTFCYLIFLWFTDNPNFMSGLLYGISFSAIIGLILVIFKISDLNGQKIGDVDIKKNQKFSNLEMESFENLLIRLFGAMGYIVECTDIENIKAFILYKNRTKAFVMFDCSNSQDDLKFINQIKTGIKENVCQKGIYVCISRISKKALEKAKTSNIDIVDRSYLQELIISYLREKWS